MAKDDRLEKLPKSCCHLCSISTTFILVVELISGVTRNTALTGADSTFVEGSTTGFM